MVDLRMEKTPTSLLISLHNARHSVGSTGLRADLRNISSGSYLQLGPSAHTKNARNKDLGLSMRITRMDVYIVSQPSHPTIGSRVGPFKPVSTLKVPVCGNYHPSMPATDSWLPTLSTGPILSLADIYKHT